MRTPTIILASLLLIAGMGTTAVQLVPPEPAVEPPMYPMQCGPVVGCVPFDTAFLVDEHGDEMTGPLFMQSNIILAEGQKIIFQGVQGALMGTSDDQPLAFVVNNVSALTLFPPGQGPGSPGGPAALGLLSPTLQAHGDLDMNGFHILLGGERFGRSPAGTLEYAGDSICFYGELCDGSVALIETGPGLTGGPISRAGTIRVADGGVTSAMIADGTIQSHDIADGTVVNADVADGSITSSKLADGGILNADLGTGSVDTRVLLDGGVQTADLANSVVTSLKIANGEVLTEDLATGAVTTLTILDGGIANVDLGAGSVDSRVLLDGGVLALDLADDVISSVKVLDGSLEAVDLATGSVTTFQILDGAILNADLATGSVDSRAILDGSVQGEDLAAGSVGSAALADEGVGAADIGAGAVTSSEILDLGVLTHDLADDVVTSVKIANGAVETADLATGAVTTLTILDGTIDNPDLAPGAVDGASILDLSVLGGDLADDVITSVKIVDGAVQSADLATGAVTTLAILDGAVAAADLAADSVDASNVLDGSLGLLDIGVDLATQAELDAFVAGLASPGTLNAADNPVDWTKLKGVPAGFADGVDDDTTYAAGNGLALSGGAFAIRACSEGQVLKPDAGGVWACGNDLDTTYAAGSGLGLEGTTFHVVPSTVQLRVGGVCAPGSSIRAIHEDGTVTCEADDDTTYSGANFALSGQSCVAGEVVHGITADGAVACAPDANTAYTAGSGLSLSGAEFALLPCPASMVPKTDATGAWQCAPYDAGTYGALAGGGLLLAGAGGNEFALLGCGVGAILQMGTEGWACAASPYFGLVAGGGLTMVGSDLALLPCAADDILKFGASGWDCAADPTYGTLAGGGIALDAGNNFHLLPCDVGKVLKVTTSGWACEEDGPRVIKCGAVAPTLPGSNAHAWSAVECSGAPVEGCVGFLSAGTASGEDEDWAVVNPGEAGSMPLGGMTWTIRSGAGPEATFRATYLC